MHGLFNFYPIKTVASFVTGTCRKPCLVADLGKIILKKYKIQDTSLKKSLDTYTRYSRVFVLQIQDRKYCIKHTFLKSIAIQDTFSTKFSKDEGTFAYPFCY